MNSNAQALEAEVILFSAEERDKQEQISREAEKTASKIEKRAVKVDIKYRFARLKRTMRRRSAAIL